MTPKPKILRTLGLDVFEPAAFLKDLRSHRGKACFSYGYKWYGSAGDWETLLMKLKQAPEEHRIFNELILQDTPVKPYLDVEWYEEDHPEMPGPMRVTEALRRGIVSIFKENWDIDLDEEREIFIAHCDRRVHEKEKKSYHIVVSSQPPVYFVNANAAIFLAKQLRGFLADTYKAIPEEIIDLGVYKKTQNFRLVGHAKEGEREYPFFPGRGSALDYVVTRIDLPRSRQLLVAEQPDYQFQSIKNQCNPFEGIVTDEDQERADDILACILEIVQEYHPSAFFEKVDTNGFVQFNYRDRREPCFADGKRRHEHLGFFAFVQDNNLVRIGCHSGQCVDGQNRKVIVTAGSLPHSSMQPDIKAMEPVSWTNRYEVPLADMRLCLNDRILGLTTLFASLYSNPQRIKWTNEDEKKGVMYFWNGKTWQEDDYKFLYHLISKVLLSTLRDFVFRISGSVDDDDNIDVIAEEGDDALKALLKATKEMINGLRYQTSVFRIRDGIIPLMRNSDFGLQKDNHPGWLSCLNGMVNLSTGEVRPAIPDDNITKTLNYNYNPEADYSEWDQFVRDISGTGKGEAQDLEFYHFVRWMVGYAIQGNPVRKLFFMLYGKAGDNGKSLFVNTIHYVLKPLYSRQMKPQVIMDGFSESASGHDTHVVALEGKRFAMLNDAAASDVISDGKMKKMTGGTDSISVREIFGREKEMTPCFVPFMNTNHKIKINLTDNALYNRLVILPFFYSFVDHPDPAKPWQRQRDTELGERFKANAEPILRWIVECGVDYAKCPDMDLPGIIRETKEEYRRDMSPHLEFINARYKLDDGEPCLNHRIRKAEFLEEFKQYWLENGNGKFVKKQATDAFGGFLTSKKIKGVMYYIGIEPKDDDDDGDDSGAEEKDPERDPEGLPAPKGTKDPEGGPEGLPEGGPEGLPERGPEGLPEGGPEGLPEGGSKDPAEAKKSIKGKEPAAARKPRLSSKKN